MGGQNLCSPSGFASVFLKQTVELNRLFQKDRIKTAIAARGMVELDRLFQKDQGKTASAARILSPNPMRRPLPCLLIKSFFYDCTFWRWKMWSKKPQPAGWLLQSPGEMSSFFWAKQFGLTLIPKMSSLYCTWY